MHLHMTWSYLISEDAGIIYEYLSKLTTNNVWAMLIHSRDLRDVKSLLKTSLF